VLELTKHGKTVRFDDTGVDKASPGRVRGCLYRGNFYEEPFLEHIRGLGRHGIYVDAGALIGTHTLYFAVLCDAEHVYAFEPRRVAREELERNVRANGLESRVTVFAEGLASEPKTVTMKMDRRDETFECIALDAVVRGPVDVIKIDVEGMELDVLRGASRILSEFAPLVFAEAQDRAGLRELEDYVVQFGYQRTGRVFNASPTYEFVKVTDLADARAQLTRAFADIDHLHARIKRAGAAEGRLEQARAENARLEALVETLRHRLARARRSLGFRLGRATAVALRDAGRNPFALASRWHEVFTGPDEILEDSK
jgi:FkbM family methyltransferase